MKKILIILVLILTSCSWKTHDQVLFGLGAGLHGLDIYSSYHYVEDDTELNRVLASMKPWEAVGSMVVSFGIMWWLADSWEEYRTEILGGWLGVKTIVTINNIEYGIP